MQNLNSEQLDALKIDIRRQSPFSHPTESAWKRAAFLGQESGDVLIEAQLRTQEIEVQYQRLFSRYVGAEWDVGSFSHNFPEINEIYKENVDDLKLDKVLGILELELQRSGGSVDIFGLSIPPEFIYNWGRHCFCYFRFISAFMCTILQRLLNRTILTIFRA